MKLTLATGMAVVSFIAGPLIAYFSAQNSTASSIGAIDTKAEVVKTRVDTIEIRLDRFENKIDALLLKNGIVPSKYAK